MKIVTYNLHCGGKGHVHWNEVIERFDPDLMFVQESYAPDTHLSLLLHGERHKHAVWDRVEGSSGNIEWGSGVYFKKYRPNTLQISEERGWITGAEVDEFDGLGMPPLRLRAFSLHAATGRGTYSSVVNAALDRLRAFRDDCELVIAGDFNLTVSPRHSSEPRTTVAADLKIQARLRNEFGLVNCWERCNPDLPLAQTLRWNNAPEVPFHCDGIFVPVRWAERLRSCTVLNGEPWTGLSDHHPIVAEFE